MKLGMVVLLCLKADQARLIGGNAEMSVVQDEQKVDKMGEPAFAPAIVVSIHGGDTPCVNLKVHGDGPGEVWATSVLFGQEEGQYILPVE